MENAGRGSPVAEAREGIEDFDFDGILKLRLRGQTPRSLREGYSPWRSSFQSPDLEIERMEISRKGFLLSKGVRIASGCFQLIDANGAICEVSPRGIVYSGAFDLDLLRLETKAMINRLIVPDGHLLLRAAAISMGGRVVVFPGRSLVGKTSILLEFLRRGASYMASGDLLVDRDGNCTLYSTSINLREHHLWLIPGAMRRLFGDERERRAQERRVSFYRLGDGLAGRNPISRNVRAFLTHRNHFSTTIPCGTLYTDREVRRSGPVADVFFFDRESKETRVLDAEPGEIARLQVASQWLARQGAHNMLSELSGFDGISMGEMVRILSGHFGKARCYKLEIKEEPSNKWVVRAANLVEETISHSSSD